ncbi:MAG TPA: glycosyl hydrolase-related protein [Spirochaetia bacterium]|nr:glycosyl hydrolase-related protein [Spirochaetia bacterium]
MRAFFVSHTHWDREWYMTREKSRYLLVGLMEELFALMEEDPGYTFMLDGQTIAIQDYLEVRPDRRELLASHVASGRITVGPWYVLPDELLVSGESHIRNYLEGQRQCRELGASMDLGYLPDSFGHPSQLPQILAGLGMNEIVFWRGLGPGITRTELSWAGKDGTEILGINLPFSYGVAACMPDEPQAFVNRLQLKLGMLAPLTDGDVILLMNGVDHVAPQKAFAANLRHARQQLPQWTLEHGTLADYLAAVRTRGLKLERAQGELRSGFRAYLLGGTISTRMYLKQANYRAELLLEKYAEPLSTLAWVQHGGRYPRAELRQAWRTLLSNLPHDSICGCGVDAIHEEMMQRYRHLEDLAAAVLETAASAVQRPAAGAQGEGGRWDGGFGVLNPLLHARSDVVRGSLVCGEQLLRKVNFDTGVLEEFSPAEDSRVPTGIVVRDQGGAEVEGLVHSVQPEDTMHLSLRTQPEMFRGRRVEFSFSPRTLPPTSVSFFDYRLTYDRRPTPPRQVENEHFTVTFEPADASLSVTDKRSGQVYPGLNVFEDGGDAGDEYTWSWPKNDRKVRLDVASASVACEGTAAFPTLVVRGILRAPARLAADRQGRSAELTDIGVESRISLFPGARRIDVRTTVANTAEDHRLRVLFPLGAHVETASAEGIFSVDERPVTPTDASAFADWVEPPSTNPQKSFVSVCAGRRGLAVANRGLPDHEVIQDENGHAVIAMTLLRCVGWLSRPDLLARKGNGGWTLPTPGAQCPGTHVFEYSIIPHAGPWDEAGVLALSHQFSVPALVFPAARPASPAGSDGGQPLVQVDRDEISLSALKAAEDGNGWIVRLWNASGRTVDAVVRLGAPAASVRRTDLAERDAGTAAGAVEGNNGAFTVRFPPWKIVTLKVDFAGNRR